MDWHPAAVGARRGTVEYLADLAPWTWFVGLTFARDISATRADDALNTWLIKLAKEFGYHFTYAVSRGPQASGRPHYHALVALPSESVLVPLETAGRVWRSLREPTGTALAAPYDPRRPGLRYMVHGHPKTIWGVACNHAGRCRRGGCKVDPGGRFRGF
jgi:hypothetical protein